MGRNVQSELVVIGASNGGLAALKQILSGLPADFPAAVLVTMHVGHHESILPEILVSYSALPVRHASGCEPVTPGSVLIAPPDHHLLVAHGHAFLSRGPKENFSRPAIDPLFRSAAAAYRTGVIGVILTGDLDDGTIGLQAIKAYGGIAIVQDPEEAVAPSMPRSAIRHVDVDFCLTLDRIVATLEKLAAQPVARAAEQAVPGWIDVENRFASMAPAGMNQLDGIAALSPFTCPECHGSLWEVDNAAPQRFRCHTGHGFTARFLASAQEQAVEEAIWAAVRALHEKASLLKRFEKRARDGKRINEADEHAAAAELARRHADALRQIAGGQGGDVVNDGPSIEMKEAE